MAFAASRHMRLVLIVAAVVFLGCVIVGSVSAEGMWVLWSEAMGNIEEGWTRVSAHASSQECERRVHDLVGRTAEGRHEMAGTPMEIRKLGENAVGIAFPGSLTIIRYSCWPETIDPRK